MIIAFLEFLERGLLVVGLIAPILGAVIIYRPRGNWTPRRGTQIVLAGLGLLVLAIPTQMLWAQAIQYFEPDAYTIMLAQHDLDAKEFWESVKNVAIVGAIGLTAWFTFRPPQGLICTTCGSENIRRYTQGSGFIEIVLWLCMVVPGLIYSIWRRNGTQKYCCNECSSLEIVPVNSPIGRSLRQEIEN